MHTHSQNRRLIPVMRSQRRSWNGYGHLKLTCACRSRRGPDLKILTSMRKTPRCASTGHAPVLAVALLITRNLPCSPTCLRCTLGSSSLRITRCSKNLPFDNSNEKRQSHRLQFWYTASGRTERLVATFPPREFSLSKTAILPESTVMYVIACLSDIADPGTVRSCNLYEFDAESRCKRVVRTNVSAGFLNVAGQSTQCY